jgi:transcriptional regulator with XRE-family HTH domain
MADELVRAVKNLRKRLAESQQAFATRLGLSIRTIANYEGGRRPSGKPLLALAQAAAISNLPDLENAFLKALSDELHGWGQMQLLMIPPTKARGAHGFLMLHLEGSDQLRGAQSCRDALLAVNSTDSEIRKSAMAALESLKKAVSDINGNPVVDQIEEAFSSMSAQQKDKK